ncbi:MAG: HEPN domain-containing protein [Patescibacteria group bacterium]
MTKQEIVKHWRKGARESLRMAELAIQEKSYSLALFHCQLATEKALKAAYISEKDSDPPLTHDLLRIAMKINHNWSEEEQDLLDDLSGYAIEGRYDDIDWSKQKATLKNAQYWFDKSRQFISLLDSI